MKYVIVGFCRKSIKKLVTKQTAFDAVRREYDLQIEPGIDETDILAIDEAGNVLDEETMIWQTRLNYITKLRRQNQEPS